MKLLKLLIAAFSLMAVPHHFEGKTHITIKKQVNAKLDLIEQ